MTEPAPEPAQRASSQAVGRGGIAVIGVILVAVGVIFLAAQQLDLDLRDVGWPFYVIVPGLAILVAGLALRNGSGLAVAGSIVTVVGLVLLYQSTADHYQSWAYAWALVGPGGSGLGMLLYGARSANAGMMRTGFWQVATGVGLFALGYLFFEGIIGISGERLPLPGWVLPAVVIAFGVVLLVRAVFSMGGSDEERRQERAAEPREERADERTEP